MRRVLLVGYDPDTVDFSDPDLPPGMTAAKIHAGVQVALKQMADRGWEADVCFIRPDQTAGPTVERQLAAKPYECVVVGAGVRLPSKRLAIFEAVINAIHKAAPTAVIAFTVIHGPKIAPMRPVDGCRRGARVTKADAPLNVAATIA